MESGESRSAGYYCHKCNITVQVPTTDLCPLCNDGFIEKLNPSSISAFADANNENREDIDSIPAVLRQVSDSYEVIVQGGDSSQGSLSDHRPSSSNRRDASSDAAQGNDRRRARNQNYAGSFEHVFSELLNTMTRPNAGNMDNNAPLFLLSNPPGDYAWGREGLDTIVTQLLNQMDSSGPPPLTQDKIQDIPLIPVSEKQFSENTQCSVCWESFKLSEHVRQLPCEHIYHDICIVPWLQLHGTCPICRKLLCEDNDSRLGFSHTGNLEALLSDVQRFTVLQGGSYPSRRRRRSNRRRAIRCYRCSEIGHIARDCSSPSPNFVNHHQSRWGSWSDIPITDGGGSATADNTQDVNGDASATIPTTSSSETAAAATATGTTRYVDIDDLDEDDDDDDPYDYAYAFDDIYSDLDYDSEFLDFDLDVMSFSGGSSNSANYVLGGSGRNAARMAAAGLAMLEDPLDTVRGGIGGGAYRARPSIRCYKCRRQGHVARNCPSAAAADDGGSSSSRQQQPQTCCRYCSKTNHFSEQCYYKAYYTGGGTAAAAAPTTLRRRATARRRAAPGGSQQQQPHQVRFVSPPPPRYVTPPPRYVSPPPPNVFSSSSAYGHANHHPPSMPAAIDGGRGTTQHQQRPVRVCYKCNTAGHIARECGHGDPRSCWLCGEKGHISRDCPHS